MIACLVRFSCLLLLFNVSFAKTQWQTLSPGLEHTVITPKHINPWAQLHAFRIDLNKYQLDLAFAKELSKSSVTVKELAQENNALLAINGGFFTPQYEPIGLRIKQGKTKHALQATSWWGVFYLQQGRPYITAQKYFKAHRHIQLAIQSGPRLVVNGQVLSLKPGVAERSAIGITKHRKIIIAATHNAPMTTKQLAEIFSRSENEDGLACRQALNLDGGSSTQLFANIKPFNLNIAGFSTISDAIVVKKSRQR